MGAPDDRVTPHDLAAERALLGAVLIDPAAYPGVASLVRPRHFYSTAHQVLALGLAHLAERGLPADPVLLREELTRTGDLDRAGGEEAIYALAEAVPTAANAAHYARVVADHALRRRRLARAQAVVEACYSPNGTPLLDELRADEQDARDLVEAAGAPGGTASRLAFRTASELRDLPQSGVEWLVDGILARRMVTVLASAPKAGKTTFVAGLIAALERGERFAGFGVRPTSCVYLSEEPAALVLDKCEAFGVERAAFLVREASDPRLSFADFVTEAGAEARRRDAALIVVDTLARFGRLGRDEEKDAGAIEALLQPVLAAAGSGLAVLLIVHHRKATGEFGEQIRGSSALLGAVDVVVELRRVKEEERTPARVLEFQSRHRETPTEAIEVEIRGGTYVRLGTTAEAQADRARDKLLAVLSAAKEPMRFDELAEAVGGKRALVRPALHDLVERGAVLRSGGGRPRDPYLFMSSQPVPDPSCEAGRQDATSSRPPVPPQYGGREREREEATLFGDAPRPSGTGREESEADHGS